MKEQDEKVNSLEIKTEGLQQDKKAKNMHLWTRRTEQRKSERKSITNF